MNIKSSIIVYFLLLPFLNIGQIDNPVPEPIVPSGKVVFLQDYAMIPSSSDSKPFARINLLREVDDGSGRLFVNDLRGPFWSVRDASPTLFVDLASEFPDFIDQPGFGSGFGAFDFHPEFSDNGIFYTTHSEATGSATADFQPLVDNGIALQWVLTEWTLTDPAATVWAGTRREILRFDFPWHTHGLQEIAFNPTAEAGDEDYGLLYICIGDGGSSYHLLPSNLQTTQSWLGTIFRIDPHGEDGINGTYGIPNSNPFADSAEEGIVKEIYAYGFRNPHRISWDPLGDQKMICGDIGEKNIEEVNHILPGKNYGWPNREGTFYYDRDLGRENVWDLPANDSLFDYTYPIAQYDHDEGVAIVGGHVYRGQDMPIMQGHYIFGDIASGRIFHFEESTISNQGTSTISFLAMRGSDGFGTSLLNEVNHDRADLRFGIDNNGEIYVLTKADGMIRRLRGENVNTTKEIISNQHTTTLPPIACTGECLIRLDKSIDNIASIACYDFNAQLVFEQSMTTNDNRVAMGQLAQGSYILLISTDSETFTKRLVKY